MITHHRSIEVLETRIAPAVVASLSHGVLSVLGDDQANEVTIAETDTQGSYLVTGLTDGPATFTGVTSIKVDLGTTTDAPEVISDIFNFVDPEETDSTLTGSLTVTAHGQTEVNIRTGIEIAGRAAFLQTASEATISVIAEGPDIHVGSLLFNAGPGAIRGQITGTQVHGDVTFRGSNEWISGSDGLDFIQSTVEGNVLVNSTAQGGTDINLYESTVTGSVRLQTSGYYGTFLGIDETSVVNGLVSVNYAGPQNSLLNVSGTLHGGINFVSAGDFNEISLTGARVDGQIRVRLADLSDGNVQISDSIVDGVDIRGGNRSMYAYVAYSTFDGAFNLQSAASDGFDLRLEQANFLQGLSVSSTGPGESLISVNEVTGSGTFKVIVAAQPTYSEFSNVAWDGDFIGNGGSGDDVFNFVNVSVSGALRLNLGEGINTVLFNDGSNAGSLYVTTGASEDWVDLNSLTITGATILSTGAGDDFVTIADSSLADFRLAAGEGNNTLHIEYGTDENGTPTIFGGSLTYTGGTGNDIVFLGDELNGIQVLENLVINVGNGGADQAYVFSSAVTGNLTFSQGEATTGEFRILYSSVRGDLNFSSKATESAIVDLWVSTVDGSVTWKSATAADTDAGITESTIGGQFTYIGGDGEDDLFFGGETVISGKTSVTLGQGDADLVWGGMEFGADVTVDGGDGQINATWEFLAVNGSLKFNTPQTSWLKFNALSIDVTGDFLLSTRVAEIEMNQLNIGGALKYRGGPISDPEAANSFSVNQIQAQDLNIVTGDIQDNIYLYNAIVTGNVTINTKGGDDGIFIEDSNLGDVKIWGGAGSDTLGIEAFESDPTGTSIGSLIFAGGDGDEQVQYGLGPDSVINILGIARFNGGTGFNQSNTLGNGSNVIFTNFVLFPAV